MSQLILLKIIENEEYYKISRFQREPYEENSDDSNAACSGTTRTHIAPIAVKFDFVVF